MTRLTAPKRPIYDTAPDYSPDGRRIVFARHKRGIYSMRPDGTGEQLVVGGVRLENPSISPEGDKLVFEVIIEIVDSACAELRIFAFRSEETTSLTSECHEGFSAVSPDWGPAESD